MTHSITIKSEWEHRLNASFYVRPEILSFAIAMESAMRKRDHITRPRWKEGTPSGLFGRLHQDLHELLAAMVWRLNDRPGVTEAAAACAVWLMAICDVAGAGLDSLEIPE